MRCLNMPPKIDLPRIGSRAYAFSQSNKGNVARSKRPHKRPRSQLANTPQITLFGSTWAKWKRAWLSFLSKTWKHTLSPSDRQWWEDEAADITWQNHFGVLGVRTGYQWFMHYQFRRFNLDIERYIPFPNHADDFPIQYASPYIPPTLAAPVILYANASGTVQISCKNVDEVGNDVLPVSLFSIYPPNVAPFPHKSNAWFWYNRDDYGDDSHYSYDLAIPFPKIRPGSTGILTHCYGMVSLGGELETDPASPDTGADAGEGDASWTDTSNICNYSASVAQCTIDGSAGEETTDRIHATGYEWEPAIPNEATITDIVADVMCQEINIGGGLTDHACYLLRAGAEEGNNKAEYSWGNDQEFPWDYQSYHWSTADLQTDWTGADLNDPDFGISFAAERTGEVNAPVATIAHVRLTAMFEAPGGWFTAPTTTRFDFL